MVAAKKKTALNRRHMTAGEYSEAMARRNAHWKGVPPAYQMRQGDEDSHELHDALTSDEQQDARRFQQGDMQKCWVGQAIEDEEREEREEREKQARHELGIWGEETDTSETQYH